jgi:hypothetical protein
MTEVPATGGHYEPEELLDYFEAKLTEGGELSVEEHLSSCERCGELAREVYAFHEVWQWPAEEHGCLLLGRLLQQALAKAEAETDRATWRQRLQRWRGDWAGKAEAALQIVMEASENTSRAMARAIDSLARPDGQWRFAPASGVPVRGVTGAESLSALLTTAVTPGKPRARVAVRAGVQGEIVVRLDELPHEMTSPLVLLIATGGALTVRVSEAAAPVGQEYRIARFNDVAPGEYLVAFEPRTQ